MYTMDLKRGSENSLPLLHQANVDFLCKICYYSKGKKIQKMCPCFFKDRKGEKYE